MKKLLISITMIGILLAGCGGNPVQPTQDIWDIVQGVEVNDTIEDGMVSRTYTLRLLEPVDWVEFSFDGTDVIGYGEGIHTIRLDEDGDTFSLTYPLGMERYFEIGCSETDDVSIGEYLM